LVTKVDGDFGKAAQATGVVTVNLTTDNNDRVGTVYGELKIEFTATNIDKSVNIKMIYKEAITT
jgi:hypothetical protein